MSTVESLMLVALGATLALILVVLFSRTMWEAALYVMRKRRDNEVPEKIIALETERNKLRAEHASMAVTMETTIADVKSRMAEQTAEVARHRNKMLSLTENVLERDKQLEARGRDIADLTNKVAELDSLSIARAMAIRELDQQLKLRQDDIKHLTLTSADLTNRLELAEERFKEIQRELDFAFATKAASETQGTEFGNADVAFKKKLSEISHMVTEVKPFVTAPIVEPVNPVRQFEAEPVVDQQVAQKNVEDIVAAARAALQAKSTIDETVTSLSSTRAERERKKNAGLAAITKRLRAMQGNA